MNERRRYWKDVPLSSRLIGLLGVFFLFSSIGFTIDVVQLGRQPWPGLLLAVSLQGGFAILYAIAGTTRRYKMLVVIFIAHQVTIQLIYHMIPPLPEPTQMGASDIAHMHARLSVSAFATMAGIMLGYACFVTVSIREGRRYFRAHAEIELATEIHRTLVPRIDATTSDFEFYGGSLPSGEVGGDLIDVVFQDDRGWIAYIADVSGHGVAPGVVMGMVKSAARMRLSSERGGAGLLEDLNSVLYSVTRPESFVTFGYLAADARGGLEYSLAGHPPILRYRASRKDFVDVACPNLPLAMFDRQSFSRSTVECDAGDLFLLLTDGVLEVENAKGEEFGLQGVKKAVASRAADPPHAIFQAILDAARHHGNASDDQSLLVVRCLTSRRQAAESLASQVPEQELAAV